MKFYVARPVAYHGSERRDPRESAASRRKDRGVVIMIREILEKLLSDRD